MLDSLFFILSKVLRPFLSPATWLILLPLIGYILGRFNWQRLSKFVWVLSVLLIVLIGFYPVGQLFLKPLEHYSQLPSENSAAPDGILVLGGAWLTEESHYWQHWELNHAADREFAFVSLAKQYSNAKLAFSGGSGKLLSPNVKEAHIAKQLYEDLGLDSNRVIFEDRSRNTYENAVYSKQLLQPLGGEVWWLVTSAYHMPRSIGVFCAQGWSMVAYPVDHLYSGVSWIPKWGLADHLWELERVSQEWFGLIVYRLTGKTTRLMSPAC